MPTVLPSDKSGSSETVVAESSDKNLNLPTTAVYTQNSTVPMPAFGYPLIQVDDGLTACHGRKLSADGSQSCLSARRVDECQRNSRRGLGAITRLVDNRAFGERTRIYYYYCYMYLNDYG